MRLTGGREKKINGRRKKKKANPDPDGRGTKGEKVEKDRM